MSRALSPVFVLIITLLSTACLPSNKFKGGTDPDDKIVIPGGGTNTGGGGIISGGGDIISGGGDIINGGAVVNGGWSAEGAPWWANVSNNTQYVTKFCNQPSPANGGSECTKESTWQHGVKEGIQYAYKATGVCQNNFVWNGSECRAPLTGGWSSPVTWWANVSDNTQYQTMYCNNPKPLTGDTPCSVPTGWIQGTKDGIVHAYQATSVCKNNFIWNGSGCIEGKYAVTSVSLNDPNIVYDLKKYWPTPASGTAFVKEYEYGNNLHAGNISDPNRARLVQRHLRDNDGTYSLEDWVVSYPKEGYTWFSTWLYKIDPSQGVVEYTDIAINRNDWSTVEYYRFSPGKELLWGNYLKLHEVLYNDVLVHEGTQSAYVWVQIKETFSTYTILGKQYNNVIKMRNLQGNCQGHDCSVRGAEVIGDYYLAEGVGFIQIDWLENDTARYLGPQSSVILTKSCTVSSSAYHCP